MRRPNTSPLIGLRGLQGLQERGHVARTEVLDDLVQALLKEDTLDQQRILEVTGLKPAVESPAEAVR